MPNGFTPNYGLSQWIKTDQVLMEEFNADNLKIDQALKAEADARAAANNTVNANLAKKGNCEIWTYTYKGTGSHGYNSPTKVTFPKMPLFAIITGSDGYVMPLAVGAKTVPLLTTTSSYLTLSVTWSDLTASWYHSDSDNCQMNGKGFTYTVLAFYKTA